MQLRQALALPKEKVFAGQAAQVPLLNPNPALHAEQAPDVVTHEEQLLGHARQAPVPPTE